ncbi:ATP-binding protein [Desulfothermus okinawensis JCM 13304]
MKMFRGKRLIDREKEIRFIKEWFEDIPDEILWIYGPKSSGKTTIIEYIVENELFEDFWSLKPRGNYWVKYINLRRYLISSYKTFLEAFLQPKKEIKGQKEKINARMSIGVFSINSEILKEVKQREKDLFNVLTEHIQEMASNKRPILIIDEIQTLQDIYINSERELLKEFLNFCVALTKELHLAHVVILSSNTVFIDRIYNDAKLKVTSRFYKVDHLDKDTTVSWLMEDGFKDKDIELIWEYLGGCIPLIQRMIREKREFQNLKEYLEYQKRLAFSEIIDFIQRGDFREQEIEIFEKIAERILKEGVYYLDKKENRDEIKVIDRWAEKEILFFDPLTREVKGNNRLYEKGMDELLGIV